MVKRRSEDQLDRALAAEDLRPNLDAEPLKSDEAARHGAQEAWVESWGGAPLKAETGRTAWWKQSKKQHAKLVVASRRRTEYGFTQPTQPVLDGTQPEPPTQGAEGASTMTYGFQALSPL